MLPVPADGGGSGSDYDYAALSDVAWDVETYLGYLKGNELVRDYVKELQDVIVKSGDTTRLASCKTKPADSQYAVTFQYMLTVVGDGDLDANRDLEEKVQTQVDKAFQSGVTWATGMAGYLQELCQPLTDPNIGAMHGVVQDLGQVKLFSLFTDDFAADGQKGIPFGGARGGLVGFFKGARDNLEDQLGQWTATMGHPKSYSVASIPSWIPDVLGVGKDITDAIPVVNDFAKLPEGVVKAGEGIDKTIKDLGLIKQYADKYLPEGQRKRPSSFTLESAEKIYTSMTSTLEHDFIRSLRTELDKLASSRTEPFRTQIDNMKNDPQTHNNARSPFKVPKSISNDDWSYADPPLR